MNDALPFGLGSWVPVLRGGAAPVAALRAEDGVAAARERWQALHDGERIALIAEGAPGRQAPLEALEAGLDGPQRVERYVVLPGTGGGFVLLPTADATTFRAGLPLLPAGRRRWSAARLGLGTLAPLGVARKLGFTELAVVTRGEHRSLASALAAEDEHLALAGGVPDARQKIVARVLGPEGAVRAFAKLAHRPDSIPAIHDERRALARVAEVAPELAPRLVQQGERDGRPWFTQELLAGHRSPDVIHEGHAAFLARLQIATLASARLAEHPLVTGALERLDTLDRASNPEWHAEMQSLADLLAADTGELATNLAHGDFTSWNLAVGPHGMRAFDWEAFVEDAPALYDLFHFHFQTGVLVHRRAGGALLDSLGPVLARPAQQLVTGAGLTAPDVLRALAVYLLHISVREELLQRRAPAPFVQVGWLRRARRELVRLVTGALRSRRAPWGLRGTAGGRVA